MLHLHLPKWWWLLLPPVVVGLCNALCVIKQKKKTPQEERRCVCGPRQSAAYLSEQGGAVTRTARRLENSNFVMDNLRELLGLRRRFSLVNVVTCDQRARREEGGPTAQEETCNPGRLGGGPALLSSHRPHEAGRHQESPKRVELHKPCVHHRPPRPVQTGGGVAEHRRPLSSHAGSPAPPWVAESPVAFLVATLWWPPVRCAAGVDFLWGAEAREDRHLGVLKVVFCQEAHAGHVS